MPLFFSILCLSNTPVYMCIFFIHSSVNENLACSCVLTILNSAAVNIKVNVLFWIIFPLDICWRMSLLDHMVTLFFSFLKETPYCSPQGMYQFAFPPIAQEGSLFPVQHLLFVDILMIVILTLWGDNLIAVLIYFSLIISHVEPLFICLLAICMYSLEKCLCKFSAMFWLVCFLFLLFFILTCMSYLYLKINPLLVALFAKFSPICGLSFPFVYGFLYCAKPFEFN